MPQKVLDLDLLEELRESGDYHKIAALMSDDWQLAPAFEDDAIRARLLAAELAGRSGRLHEMESALAPYLDDLNHVPFGYVARVLLAAAVYYYRRNEPSEALKLATRARSVAAARDEERTVGEAAQLAGQSLWSLERWSEASDVFRETIDLYASQSRTYRLGLAYLCLGAVMNRTGQVEDARIMLERSIKILLKSQDEYNLAVARVNVAAALNAIGEHDTALDYLKFARDTFEQMGHDQYAYLTLNGVAAAQVWTKKYDAAEVTLQAALEKGVKARSTQIASTYEIKARLHLARREPELAERTLAIASEIAAQANSQSQKAEVQRTLGRYYLAQERAEEAATVLGRALEIAEELRASLLEMEIKALLAQAVCVTNPVEAVKMISDVEAALGDRPLPELRKEAQAARKRISSLDQEHYFILSDGQIPLLADAKISLLKWLWARALYKARGNAREAAKILGVTPTYIRKLTKAIPRDQLRPGRKRSKKDHVA
jgi:tetratricopeptide (TPR) repeat protein